MAIIIPFQQLLERRQREYRRGVHQQCLKILECNYAYAQRMYDVSQGFEREVWQRRVNVLGALLRYAERCP